MLKITVEHTTQLDKGIWLLGLPPHQLRLFGRCEHASGCRSVVLLKAATYSSVTGELTFKIDDATALNIGNTSDAIAILEDSGIESPPTNKHETPLPTISKGDREFIALVKSLLDKKMQIAAEKLLMEVRAKSPGELKRGKSYNFSDTPDNFWYVIIQPRIQQLSITVRGPTALFEGVTHLPVKDDRGNTLFKITGETDIEAALKLIFRAKRKK